MKNQGGTNAPASHTKVQIKSSGGTQLLAEIFSTAGIGANSSVNESRTLTIPSNAPAGSYNAFVIVDNNSEVTQSNTTNDTTNTTFTVLGPSPVINGLDPLSGKPGTVVTIKGNNFGVTQDSSFVSFGGTQAAINSWSNTQIKAVAPAGLSGTVAVTVKTSSGTSNEQTFTYEGSTDSFKLVAFPLKGLNSGNAPIVSVFDHSMKCLQKHDPDFCTKNNSYRIYGCNAKVEAYTGEIGDIEPDEEGICAKHPGYAQDADHTSFEVNGHYVGSGGVDWRLNYDGHPGFDYHADIGTEVHAAVTGTIRYPKNIVGLRDPDEPDKAYNKHHVLELIPDESSDYTIYYLHLSTHPICLEDPTANDCFSHEKYNVPNHGDGCPTSLPPAVPELHVKANCVIALSGEAGAPQHLHFEVQRVIPKDKVKNAIRDLVACVDEDRLNKACVPVDPYGWDTIAGAINNLTLVTVWA